MDLVMLRTAPLPEIACYRIRGWKARKLIEVRMSDIKVERRGEVEWIRLNRPDRMNAYDAEMARKLIEAVENASDAGVIVLTGTGRAFCAGAILPT